MNLSKHILDLLKESLVSQVVTCLFDSSRFVTTFIHRRRIIHIANATSMTVFSMENIMSVAGSDACMMFRMVVNVNRAPFRRHDASMKDL